MQLKPNLNTIFAKGYIVPVQNIHDTKNIYYFINNSLMKLFKRLPIQFFDKDHNDWSKYFNYTKQ